MADDLSSWNTRDTVLGCAQNHIRRNPQLWLAVILFCSGSIATADKISPLAGALFGAGASLLGAWITELSSRRSAIEERLRRESEAARYLCPELSRTIERALYIHGRAIPNFVCASVDADIKPNDVKDDFLPYEPVLYPDAPQFQDLSGDRALALVAFYDSLHSLKQLVNGWWQREGQSPVNIFNLILHSATDSLNKATICIALFDLDGMFPPNYKAWGTLSSRVERSLSLAESALKHHIERAESKSANKATSPGKKPKL